MKKIIVWDVDDVLNNLTRDFFHVYALGYQKNIKYEDLIKYDFYDILQMTKAEYLYELDRYRLFSYTLQNEHILNWFKKYGNNFYHIALTATPRKIASLSVKYVMEIFGNWIQAVNFVYSKRDDDNSIEYFKSKGEWLKWFGKADFFIDDNEQNLEKAKELNPELTCYCPKQPWNNGIPIEEILENLSKRI
jgi:5'(3')-deoxyribonucleotidase